MADFKQIVRYVLRKKESELIVDIATIQAVQCDYTKEVLTIKLSGGAEVTLNERRAVEVYLDIKERLANFDPLAYVSTFETIDFRVNTVTMAKRKKTYLGKPFDSSKTHQSQRNKKEFAYLMLRICGAYETFNYPSLTGTTLSKKQVKAIELVVNLKEKRGLDWFRDCVLCRMSTK
jgi:hypothetical protein